MEQQSSTSTVTVEYHDPHDVYKLLAPGIVPRLPLHNLHWQSHAGPLRSIGTLHVDLVRGDGHSASTPISALRRSDSTVRDDGFQTQQVGGRANSTETVETTASGPLGPQRRHQIPGLRRTPYLKVLLVRCDDNESYKTTIRSEVREWIKTNTPPSTTSKKANNQENHDAFEWFIVHVVIPNTAAATQPRSGNAKSESSTQDSKSTSRWRTGSTPLMDKFRSDFNETKKGAQDRISQIRIGINDVPYEQLPRVVPAVPSGYSENVQDAENAWTELMMMFKSMILSSFDKRVTQYEDDIKEKDSQRNLPGWNFCTFFILKEGLARGFENVGLVEDASVGYDELSIGLDSVLAEVAGVGSSASALPSYTEDLKAAVELLVADATGDGEEEVDLQSQGPRDQFDDIPIVSTKKAYREMILANKSSAFDFRCYIFSRQIALLLRLGNASSTREELLAKLKEQQESVLHGIAPLAPPPKPTEEKENLAMLADICRRSLQFIPVISQLMRQDISAAMAEADEAENATLKETVDNVVASFAFSVAQQILAQTSTKALPIPPTTLLSSEEEQKASIPEPKTMLHPARSSSMYIRSAAAQPPPSPGIFPGPGRRMSLSGADAHEAHTSKAGLEELAARRADLYVLSRSVLDGLGKKRGWSNGWAEAPMVGEPELDGLEEISLDDEADPPKVVEASPALTVGIGSFLLRTAIETSEDYYRLYEILTDKSLRHFTVANYDYSVQANMADLAVLKFYMKDYRAASYYFYRITPFFSENGWNLLELSMLSMYAQCLHEMQSKQDYVRVALKLLTKASAAEKDWLDHRKQFMTKGQKKDVPDMASLKGVVSNLLELAPTLQSEHRVPLASFVTDVELVAGAEYAENRDSCSLSIRLSSLLPEDFKIDAVALRVSSLADGPVKEIQFERKGEVTLARGKNTLKVDSNNVVPGKYRIDRLSLSSSKILLHFDRDVTHPPSPSTDIFRSPDVALQQRPGALDVSLAASRQIALDKNNSLDLTLSTGWNTLTSCEIKVKPMTGGLRLITQQAKLAKESDKFTKAPEAGAFSFGPQAAESKVTLSFPYTTEQDQSNILIKLEVFYTSEAGEPFYLAKIVLVPVLLVLGVNVQDVFKHQALFSRFNVYTATSSPLRLYESELVESELFETPSNSSSIGPLLIFPKQPATLLFKVKRKEGVKSANRSGKTMYLKLMYTTLQSEIEELIGKAIGAALEESSLNHFRIVVLQTIIEYVRSVLTAGDLERAALLNRVSTKFLAQVPWNRHFNGLGTIPGTQDDAGQAISSFLTSWQSEHIALSLPSLPIVGKSSLLIPVELPSVPVVHTADIKFQSPLHSLASGSTPTVTLNQVLPATLHLKWTRIWDTNTAGDKDLEFSYEITAPGESWLLGGRRKGHFILPSSTASSTPETEANIPLVLIPQREGWLPFPSVEIRDVVTGQPCEVDCRNIGETVRVVGTRTGVTVSLDASGPGGGPLVIDAQEMVSQGRVVL